MSKEDSKPRNFSTTGIQSDLKRFDQIIKGKIRKNLKQFITKGDMKVPTGGKEISIPMENIDLPRFIIGSKDQEGVGQGDGQPGDEISDGDSEKKSNDKAGNQPAEHDLDVSVDIETLAEILGEELCLPKIKPKGNKSVQSESQKYSSIRKVGPQSLSHYKRTYKEALKRQVSLGNYDEENPIVTPIKSDFRYRSSKLTSKPDNSAAIIYIMDVSGSMGNEQKEIVRLESFWIDAWLKKQYQGIERRYIIHDASAKEVDQKTFFQTKESGGTLISSAYKLALDIIEKSYPSDNWNIYIFHFSDGDNWSSEDTKLCMRILQAEIFPKLNQFSYGQVDSRYGSGQFYRDLLERFTNHDCLVVSRIPDKESIYESIKTFLGTGK